MLRYILYAIVGYLLYKIIGVSYKNYKAFQGQGSDTKKARGGEKLIKGEMVKDPICETYIPKDNSIKERIGGKTVYFCSQECREQYIKNSKAQIDSKNS